MIDPDRFDPQALALSIDIDGNWRHQGEIITHPRILAMLFAGLKKDGPEYVICAENLRVPVRVADCAYVVLSVRHLDEGIRLLLTDGAHEMLNPAVLTIDEHNVPRTVVKNGEFPARFSRAAWAQLAEAVREDGKGGYTLTVGGKKHPLKI